MNAATVLAIMMLLGVFIAFPAMAALRRRDQSRDDSDIALALQAFAQGLRREEIAGPDPQLVARVAGLVERVPETRAFLFALELTRLSPPLLADAAQRLGLRLRRRVAFERKMLARTRSGLRRAAVVAAFPAVLALGCAAFGMRVPTGPLIFLLVLEGMGCFLLWRITRAAV